MPQRKDTFRRTSAACLLAVLGGTGHAQTAPATAPAVPVLPTPPATQAPVQAQNTEGSAPPMAVPATLPELRLPDVREINIAVPRQVRAAQAMLGMGKQRLALVLGLGKVGHRSVVDSAARNTQAVSAALRSGGFVVMTREDLTAADLRATLKEFRERLQPGGVGFVYVTGLGAQVDGRNLLLPRDAALDASMPPDRLAKRLAETSVPLDEVADALIGTPDSLRLLVVEAAWQHPVLATLPQQGLAQPRVPHGMMAMLGVAPGVVQEVPAVAPLPLPAPTAPAELAATPFVRTLVGALLKPRINGPEVLRNTRRSMVDATLGQTSPWIGGDTDDREELAEASLLDGLIPRTPEEIAREALRQGSRLVTRPAVRAAGEKSVAEVLAQNSAPPAPAAAVAAPTPELPQTTATPDAKPLSNAAKAGGSLGSTVGSAVSALGTVAGVATTVAGVAATAQVAKAAATVSAATTAAGAVGSVASSLGSTAVALGVRATSSSSGGSAAVSTVAAATTPSAVAAVVPAAAVAAVPVAAPAAAVAAAAAPGAPAAAAATAATLAPAGAAPAAAAAAPATAAAAPAAAGEATAAATAGATPEAAATAAPAAAAANQAVNQSTDTPVADAARRAAPATTAATEAVQPSAKPSPAEAPSTPAIAVPRRNPFGYTEGDSFTYQVVDTWADEVVGEYTTAIDEVMKDGALRANGQQLQMDPQGRPTRLARPDGSFSIFEPHQDLWWADPKRGDRRVVRFIEKFQRADQTIGQTEWRGGSLVARATEIETPAGKFDVLPIESTGTWTETLANGTRSNGQWTRTVYYSPKLKHPVAIDVRDADAMGRPLRRERIQLMHAQQARPTP
ncbi:caspase family protein [Rubrivivax rivuli]|uniref:Caspase family p20 domain-containing protein n=1 Tax=Rubrivivax rivuli TaxID=1862385 RepID=A0A437RS15_9BURK|nr:caspase family protein [Rubrivivax rivuli]RVU49545.1 hypothetical protein EOE66_02975 [Rubrivivax rivuli]